MFTVIKNHAAHSVLVALSSVLVLCSLYFLVEPQVGRAVVGTPFSISQEIGAEISFLVQAANVTMFSTSSSQISSLTGGNSTGTTQVVVLTNNANGYYMEIAFSDADGDGTIMRRNNGGTSTASLRNYSTSTRYNSMVEPSFGFSFASTAAQFAYTVTASSADDIDQSFKNNGSACGVGTNTTQDTCWMAPTTTAFRIIQTNAAAPSGSTSTVRFRVYVPPSPSPAVDTGFYTATATLSAFNI
jgi:hypothetical protein